VIIVDKGLERSKQRNIGIDRAKGEFILILDSDQSVSPMLIGECVARLNLCTDTNSLYIPETLNTPGFWGRVRDWERKFYTSTPVDCVRFVRTANCPKFDETLTGPEDADWSNRIEGGKDTTTACLYHNENMGIIEYLRKKAYYAKSMRKYANKWKRDKVLNPLWRCFLVFVENRKWKKFIRKPIYAMAVMALILARGVVYLWNR
jgi:glycosyltransferase involved in cell wall biosynthesis